MSFRKIAPVKKAHKCTPAPKPAPRKREPKKPDLKRPVGHK
ncbi:hypothetical protein ACH45E_40865 [Streptomyces sp. NPDC020299]